MSPWTLAKQLCLGLWHALQGLWHAIHLASPILIFAGVIAGFILVTMGAQRLSAPLNWWGFLLIAVSLYWGIS